MIKNKNNEQKQITPRFLAMSKLIGIFIAIVSIIIIIYSMYEMHFQNDLSSLSQLIISIFGINATYIGFYLTMAKWEHIEIEKSNREKDLLKLKKKLELYNEQEQIQEDTEKINNEINDLDMKQNEIDQENFTNNY